MKVGSADGENKQASDGEPQGLSPKPGLVQTEEAYDIRIARDGTWYHEGAPIRRIELAKLFATVLRRDEAGDYWLITPAERGRIAVEDAPFLAVEMTVQGQGKDQVLSFRTNLDEWVDAGPDHPIRVVHNPETGEPTPYIDVRDGLEARIQRSVFYEMVDLAEPAGQDGQVEVGVWSRKVFFVLGRLPGD